MTREFLPIAVRAYARRADPPRRRSRSPTRPVPVWPTHVLIFDTETTTDRTQRLLFGSYRFCQWSGDGAHLRCVDEGFFYADDLPRRDPTAFRRLERFVETHRPDVARGADTQPNLRWRSRAEFVDKVLFKAGYDTQALLVGFNLPFDLSRVAVQASPARRRRQKSFSFVVFDHDGKESQFRPRVLITPRDSKGAFFGFGSIRDRQGRPVYAGRFLDLRTFAHALTDTSHTLASACAAFGVAHPKARATRHGHVTPSYIAYNRRDVLATQELLEKLRAEFDRHPIRLLPDKAYSPASIAKAYLGSMGLTPLGPKLTGIGPAQIGATLSAYYGGRAEVHIRWTPVPVTYVDFLSMYPTVNALMGLWDVHVAKTVTMEDATDEVRRLLKSVKLARTFDPRFWKTLTFYARIVPDGEILPVRAQYGDDDAFTIGLNPLTSEWPLWVAGPDLAASVLLSGKAPKVLRAVRVVAQGTQAGLRPVAFRGQIPVDPLDGDFFRRIIELRTALKGDERYDPTEREWLRAVLKTQANSGAYGIFAEFNRQDQPPKKPVEVIVHTGARPFRTKTTAPEEPGRWACPPIAALITAGARLMLAMLERSVTDRGGTWAFCDTDSMAIVASRDGGLVPCVGGPEALPGGHSAITALSWDEVDRIVACFAGLSPYDRKAVPGSILKIEDVNFDKRGSRHTLWCLAISAKRYALYTRSRTGRVVIHECKEHGLGHLLNPLDPERQESVGQRGWITELWRVLIADAYGRATATPDVA